MTPQLFSNRDNFKAKTSWLAALMFVTSSLSFAPAALAADISYIYDELGRLRAVVDPDSDTAVYSYDSVGNVLSISRHSSSDLVIIDFGPKSGSEGSEVRIFGTGFSTNPSDNTVKFNGVIASNVISATETSLVVTVPISATTGAISVATPSGVATSSGDFIVTEEKGVPTITGFSPTMGKSGTSVTITGANFEVEPDDNLVKFDRNITIASSSTETTIETTVPTGPTGTGPISVTTPQGKAVSAADFVVIPDPYTVDDVESVVQIDIGGPSWPMIVADPDKVAVVTFKAIAGQFVSFGITDVTFPNLDVAMYIYAPGGGLLASNPYIRSSGDDLDTRIAATGTHTIVVAGKYGNTGSLTLTPSYALLSNITVGGPPASVTSTVPGQDMRISFTGAAGQYLSVGTTNITFPNLDSTVSILDPGGNLVAHDGWVDASGDQIDTQLLVTGTHTIVFEGKYANTGGGTLTLSEAIAGDITIDGSPVSVILDRPGQDARVSFTGTVGQYVSLGSTNITFPNVGSSVSILDPDGNLVSHDGWVDAISGDQLDTQLQATGTHTIVFGGHYVNTGGGTLTLSEAISENITIDGPPVSVTLDRPGQDARVSFTGTAGQYVSLGTTNSMFPHLGSSVSILNPDGSALASDGWVDANNGDQLDTQLQATGTHTIVIGGHYANTGGGTLTLSEAISENITIDGPPVDVTLDRPGQDARVSFTGTAGQYVSLGNTNNTFPHLGSSVSILNPDGSVLAVDGWIDISGDQIDTQLLVTGTHTIVFGGLYANTGGGTLTLSEAISGNIIIDGPPVDVTLSRPGQDARYTFEGTAQEPFVLNVTDVTFPHLGSGIWIYNPDGTLLASEALIPTTGASMSLTLPATGTYTVWVEGYGAFTGGMTLLPFEPEGAGTSETITVDGPSVLVHIDQSGQVVEVTFEGTVDDYVSLGVSSHTFPACQSEVIVTKPDGSNLTSSNCIFSSGIGFDMQLPDTGTYTIVVMGKNNNTGSLTLTLTAPISGTIEVDGPALGVTLRPGQDADYTFEGTAGEYVSLGGSNITLPFCGSSVNVLKPDGSLLASSGCVAAPQGLTYDMQLPETGTYTVTAEGTYGYEGSITLTLTTPIAGPIDIDGDLVDVDLSPGQDTQLTFDGTPGQALTLSLSDVTFSFCGATVHVLKPDGSSLVWNECFSNTGSTNLNMTLPVAGTYTVVAEGKYGYAGGMTLGLSTQ